MAAAPGSPPARRHRARRAARAMLSGSVRSTSGCAASDPAASSGARAARRSESPRLGRRRDAATRIVAAAAGAGTVSPRPPSGARPGGRGRGAAAPGLGAAAALSGTEYAPGSPGRTSGPPWSQWLAFEAGPSQVFRPAAAAAAGAGAAAGPGVPGFEWSRCRRRAGLSHGHVASQVCLSRWK